RREALAHRILPTVFQDLRSQLGQPHPLTTITGARRASGQTHSRARSHQATPTSVPAAPHPNPFHPSECEGAHANSFEDAQWADATSLELLDLTVERVRQLPVLALFTFRPEFEPPWVGLPNVGTLTLGRLDRSNVESMVERVTGGRVLPAEVMKQIVTKTDGNPLFVEELTKAVLEAGILLEEPEGYRLDGPLPPLAIPETLQDSLMARLDRLAPVREIAQIAAAIGREFSYSLVRALVGRDETALKHGLAQLEQAELVFRRGEPP